MLPFQHDISLIFELVAAIKVKDRRRTEQLRRRYLALVLDGLRARDGDELPGPPPSWQEINERWAAWSEVTPVARRDP